MIETPTTFILGAGAHCSYGFPSGEELKTKVANAVHHSLQDKGDNDFFHMATFGAAKAEEVQEDCCRAFSVALNNAGQGSIDAFLDANQHMLGFQTIGKGAIAQVLLEYERKSKFLKKDDWLTYLIKRMHEGIRSKEQFIEQNNVSFITFNYDRFLETRLFHSIKHSFGIDDAVALKVLEQIPIYHVYGMLGTYLSPTDIGPKTWIEASKGIRTIFETKEHDQPTLNSARALLAQAHNICLLGFGFHKENIELLQLVEYLTNCKGDVVCSKHDITDAEWYRFTKSFSKNRFTCFNDSMCLKTLRNWLDLSN